MYGMLYYMVMVWYIYVWYGTHIAYIFVANSGEYTIHGYCGIG